MHYFLFKMIEIPLTVCEDSEDCIDIRVTNYRSVNCLHINEQMIHFDSINSITLRDDTTIQICLTYEEKIFLYMIAIECHCNSVSYYMKQLKSVLLD